MIDILQLLILVYIAYTLSLKDGKLSIPHIPKKAAHKVILDSCALIDGRILELSQSGFVPDQLIVPEFILHELQLLADGADTQKRTRARFGLDVVKKLQDNPDYAVVIDHTKVTGRHTTDDKLITLAKKLNAQLYTTDFNLNKVAEIEGVKVLNVNELAQNMRPSALPGEQTTVKIVQHGSNPKQGVGYTDEGTMLVVEDGASHIGKEVKVEITRMHQTVAGKMLFADLIQKKPTRQPASQPTRRTKRPAAQTIAARMKRSDRRLAR